MLCKEMKTQEKRLVNKNKCKRLDERPSCVQGTDMVAGAWRTRGESGAVYSEVEVGTGQIM